MSNITHITDHEDQALARLTSMFRDQTLIEGMLRSFVGQYQDSEDTIDDLLTDRTIDTAIGQQLDGYGQIVGELRNGRDDDTYRIALKARTGRNTSEGTPDDILNVFNLLSGSTSTQLIEYVAVITLTANVDFSSIAAEVKAFTQKVLPAGVRLDYVSSMSASPAFGFLGVPGASGFEDSTAPGGGGTFVSAF